MTEEQKAAYLVQSNPVQFKNQNDGSVWVPKYRTYMKNDLLAQDCLAQLEKNYESVYDMIPSKDDLTQAIKFVELFLAEIGETCAPQRKSGMACELGMLIDEDDPIHTALNIAECVQIAEMYKNQLNHGK